METISEVSEALRVIEDVNETSSKCMVNKHQCQTFATRLNDVGAVLKEFGTKEVADTSSPSPSKMDYPAFEMLLSILRKGQALVSKYVDSPAIVPSVLIGKENREAFQELHSDLDTMNSQFCLESFEFTSEDVQRRRSKLQTDAEKDLEEIPESLDLLACTDRASAHNLEQVKLAVSEKTNGTGDSLPSFLKIDPAAVEVYGPVREPERLSKHDPVETDGWALVRHGSWISCKCAVKVFQSTDKTWNGTELRKEAEALLNFSHPHIVQLIGFAQDADKCLILLELMDTDLRHFMKSRQGGRPFSRSQELDIIAQIARAMIYLHDRQYVHGELKCSNILVKQHPGDVLDVKISDLRSSQRLGVWDFVSFKERSQRSRQRWTAPEVRNYGELECPPAVWHELLKKMDVYSFGMVCYEVVTGKLPFQDIRGAALDSRIATGELKQDLPGDLDSNLRGLIESCWERDPEKRPTFELICHHLEFIRSSQPLFQPVATVLSSGIETVIKRFNQIRYVLRFLPAEAKNNLPASTWGDRQDLDVDGDSGSPDSEIQVVLPEFVRINQNDLKKGPLLGKGSYAKVYEATWLGCKCAVKAFTIGSTIDKVQKELKFLIELRHPSIVRLMGSSFSSNNQCMIVMEFMAGDLRGEINRRMKSRQRNRGPFELAEMVSIINKIALGMAYLHSRGVIHRDLKANNVLVPQQAGSMDVKITDFGVSEFSKDQFWASPVGTSYWRAPEVLSRQLSSGYMLKAADVYSFGMTCYEVVTGGIPCEELIGGEGKSAVIDGFRPSLPSDLLPSLKKLIEDCWDGVPAKRPAFRTICCKLQEIQQDLTSLCESVQ